MITRIGRTKQPCALALLIVSLLAASTLAQIPVQPKDWRLEANGDPVLQAMRAELDRAKSNLKLDHVVRR
jgi:cellulose biosynthesis protein BcsQ